MPPRVFIGSSSESLDLAKAIQHNLGNTADCVIWKQNFFKPSTYPLEQLETEVGNFDFGIFVFSPDDLVRIRNKHFFAVRDNVIFELGLFIGRIGRRRNFIVVPKDTPKLRLPSDLLGLTNVSYDPHRSDENWVAAIGTACYLIETTIKELGYLREPYIHTPAKAAKAVQKYKSDLIKPYLGWGFGDSLEIQPSPDLQEGWLLSQVEIHHNETDPFILPPEHEQAYKEYFEKNYIRKRFADDGEKFMLALNPTSFEEAPTLRLQTRLTKYSMQHFYRDVISKRTFESGRLIHDLIRGSLRVGFPHALNLQMVIATKDDKLLLTQRSPKVSSYAYTWSCSVEEDLKRSDLQEGPKRATEAGVDGFSVRSCCWIPQLTMLTQFAFCLCSWRAML